MGSKEDDDKSHCLSLTNNDFGIEMQKQPISIQEAYSLNTKWDGARFASLQFLKWDVSGMRK